MGKNRRFHGHWFGILGVAVLAPACSPSHNRPAGGGTSTDDVILPHEDIACTSKAMGGTCDVIWAPVNYTPPAFPAQTTKDGSSLTAGSRVCLQAGVYDHSWLTIKNLRGTEAQPIEITNCGGKFVIGNSAQYSTNALKFQNNAHIKISGTGSTAHHYGIEVAGTSDNNFGMLFILSTDFEVSYVELGNIMNSGISAKTDPGCTNDVCTDATNSACWDTNPTAFRAAQFPGGFVQKNTRLHDLYIHDTAQEGIYLGYSHGNGWPMTCNGNNVTGYSHRLLNTTIYRNRIENTGREGFQIAMGDNTVAYGNFVKDYGQESGGTSYGQNNGIQMGDTSNGVFHGNYIWNSLHNAQGYGIIVLGTGDQYFYNNTIVDAAAGIYVGLYPESGRQVRVANNTISNVIGTPTADGHGIDVYNNTAQVFVKNNLIVLGNPTVSGSQTLANSVVNQWYGSTVHQSGNVAHLYADLSNVFANPAAGDFHLLPGSSAINAGSDVSSYSLPAAMGSVDTATGIIKTQTRVRGSAIDVGAWENQ